MKKIIIFGLFLLLVGCQNMTPSNNKLSDDEINLKYEEMKNKLIEYGKLVYENKQWLNEKSEIITTDMSLRDLSERNGYDISMFVNPETGKKCDLDNSKIEFIISNVDDLENIEYKFNPILVCEENKVEFDNNNYYYSDNEIVDKKDEITLNKEETDLLNILVGYMVDIYDTDEYMNGGLKPKIYKVSLREFQQKGYDISMFVNDKIDKKCDLDNTYGIFEVFGNTKDGKTDYVFGGNLEC